MGRRECKTEPHVVSLSLSPARSTLVSLSFTWCLISRLQSFTLLGPSPYGSVPHFVLSLRLEVNEEGETTDD